MTLAKYTWDLLFIASVSITLKRYGIKEGVLVLDESENVGEKLKYLGEKVKKN